MEQAGIVNFRDSGIDLDLTAKDFQSNIELVEGSGVFFFRQKSFYLIDDFLKKRFFLNGVFIGSVSKKVRIKIGGNVYEFEKLSFLEALNFFSVNAGYTWANIFIPIFNSIGELEEEYIKKGGSFRIAVNDKFARKKIILQSIRTLGAAKNVWTHGIKNIVEKQLCLACMQTPKPLESTSVTNTNICGDTTYFVICLEGHVLSCHDCYIYSKFKMLVENTRIQKWNISIDQIEAFEKGVLKGELNKKIKELWSIFNGVCECIESIPLFFQVRNKTGRRAVKNKTGVCIDDLLKAPIVGLSNKVKKNLNQTGILNDNVLIQKETETCKEIKDIYNMRYQDVFIENMNEEVDIFAYSEGKSVTPFFAGDNGDLDY